MEMKRNPLAGTGKVYSFTLKQMLCKKAWIITTALIGALFLIGIPLVFWGISAAANDDEEDTDKPTVKTVLVADETEGEADYNLLKAIGYEDVTYTAYDTAEAAVAAVSDADSTLVLRVTKSDGTYLITAILPEDTALSRSDASAFANFVSSNFKTVLMEKAQLSPEAAALLSVPISSSVSELKEDSADDDTDDDGMKSFFRTLIPFMMVMLMYMMVILYGQSMANSVMLEKTSKLMETILTAVHPVALMTGKLFATATAAILQILIWLGCLLGGIFGGAFFALKMIPDTQNATVQTVDMIAENSGSIFSLSGIFLALLLIALSFLLYLCLGAVSGAMASKTEDLAKTNYVFILVILASFFLCLSFPSPETASGSEVTFVSTAAWLQYFPFTSVFVTPGRLILGDLGLGPALGAVACMLIGVALLIWIAAVIYKALVLYRGTPPTPKALLAMIRQNKEAKSAK